MEGEIACNLRNLCFAKTVTYHGQKKQGKREPAPRLRLGVGISDDSNLGADGDDTLSPAVSRPKGRLQWKKDSAGMPRQRALIAAGEIIGRRPNKISVGVTPGISPKKERKCRSERHEKPLRVFICKQVEGVCAWPSVRKGKAVKKRVTLPKETCGDPRV